MVGTVAGDGAPRSLSVVRSSGVCWTRPFSFSDSSLVRLRPFSLPMFHPAHALCVIFVALSCLLRYWLGFYLNWQPMTTVSLELTFRQLHIVHNNMCSKPLFTKFNRLSILVANSQPIICLTLRICSIFQPMKTASDGWHACSRRCQLALDLAVRGTGYTYPPLHSPGDCIVVGVFCVFCFVFVAFKETDFQWICDSSLSFRWQKGDRPDNDLRWAMQHSDKKKVNFHQGFPPGRACPLEQAVPSPSDGRHACSLHRHLALDLSSFSSLLRPSVHPKGFSVSSLRYYLEALCLHSTFFDLPPLLC